MIITECQEFYGDCGNSKRERTLDTLGLCLKLDFLSHKLKSLVIPEVFCTDGIAVFVFSFGLREQHGNEPCEITKNFRALRKCSNKFDCLISETFFNSGP